MNKFGLPSILVAVVVLAVAVVVEAQQPKVYRVGVLIPGAHWYEIINGFRAGLKELGIEDGKHLVLQIRDTKGDLKAAEEAARNLEQQKVDLIFTSHTSVTIAAKRATADIPIVFSAGADPVVLGLVESFAKTGGRFTGVYEPGTDITAKRLEILREIVPKLRRILAFYEPRNPVASESARLAREEIARLQGVEFVERHFARSRNFRPVYERSRREKWVPSSSYRTQW